MSLYSINEEAKELLANLDKFTDMETGEISEDFFEIQEDIANRLTDKFDNIGKVIKSIEADNKSIDDEIDRLSDRKKKNANKVLQLMKYTQFVMERFKLDKGEGMLFTFQYTNSKVTVIADESRLPPELKKKDLKLVYTQEEVEIIEKALKEVGINFEEIPGTLGKPEIKKYIDGLSEEEREAFKPIAYIEEKKTLKIK